MFNQELRSAFIPLKFYGFPHLNHELFMKQALKYQPRAAMKLVLGLMLFFCGISAPPLFARNQPEKEAAKDKVTVYIFLAETCPVSQFYTLSLKDLHREFASKNLEFIGIFPNKESTEETIAEFKDLYKLPFTLQSDPGQELTKKMKVTVTPEVVVKNEVSGEVLYQGRIDDTYYQVGKKRPVAREHDLKNALTSLKTGKKVAKTKTDAVG